ncbi:cbb3-type cytochrome c oxidase subunit 3 [Paracoccus aurantiacus]|uniref:Cbb3-type cytochrome c oxidase subunit 3 n=1 Tax=Paracoccus aurantiacus TaxID=2599412 RepID=A0A5C6SBT1_9RHOB|nr:cbb3-type cytochrome c oxidase subunit 3 [Paracoccus aurantiacus]TXB71075.1 cbb3-type cytochrome c oxidase subunit 3 [Paracoccus aurantiacus]
MDIYTLTRAFADSWALLALVLIFLCVILFVFRPGARNAQQDAAKSIFRNETRPAPPEPEEDQR